MYYHEGLRCVVSALIEVRMRLQIDHSEAHALLELAEIEQDSSFF